jgi:hypothetical protein
MTATRLFASAAALLTLCACFEGRALEVRTISLDHLTAAQAAQLVEPYLSAEGKVFFSKELHNAITVRDHSRNVERVRSMLTSRDASPAAVSLHFQLIRATDAGAVDVGLERMADALGDVLRFKGYQLMSEAVVSGTERGMVQQSLDGGGIPLQLSARVSDVRGMDRSGSVELDVDLRQSGGALLATNVVVPVGQTVVLGTAYPASDGSALILTVRGEMGSQRVRSSSRGRRAEAEATHGHDHDVADVAIGRAVGGAAAGSVIQVDVMPAEVHSTKTTTTVVVPGSGTTYLPGRATKAPAGDPTAVTKASVPLGRAKAASPPPTH